MGAARARDILDDLQEEEELHSLNSQYEQEEQRSFINLSVSDLEEAFEKRDASSPEPPEERPKSVAAANHNNSAMRQPPQHTSPQQNQTPKTYPSLPNTIEKKSPIGWTGFKITIIQGKLFSGKS